MSNIRRWRHATGRNCQSAFRARLRPRSRGQAIPELALFVYPVGGCPRFFGTYVIKLTN